MSQLKQYTNREIDLFYVSGEITVLEIDIVS